MKTKIDHLLGCVTEEAGEVSQIIGKMIRFGIYDFHEKTGNIPNIELLNNEIHDLLGAWHMLCEELEISSGIFPDKIADKQERIKYYMEYAQERGELEL